MRSIVLIFLIFAALVAWSQDRKHSLTGNIVIHPQFHSKFLVNDRDIIVYLPPSYYDHPRERYPVLYMHDGQNLFDVATCAFGTEWNADETAETMIKSGKISPVIIVGIYNTKARMQEYMPTADLRFSSVGGAEKYGHLIVDELKPFIDKHYRTKRGTSDTTIGGASLGGLVSLYLGLQYPKVFGAILAVSPSIWWNGQWMIEAYRKSELKYRPKIWLDMGTQEGSQKGWLEESEGARKMRDVLVEKGWKLNENFRFLEVNGGIHSESSWSKRFDKMLLFLYGVKP